MVRHDGISCLKHYPQKASKATRKEAIVSATVEE
jgi:hypothetical protein